MTDSIKVSIREEPGTTGNDRPEALPSALVERFQIIGRYVWGGGGIASLANGLFVRVVFVVHLDPVKSRVLIILDRQDSGEPGNWVSCRVVEFSRVVARQRNR